MNGRLSRMVIAALAITSLAVVSLGAGLAGAERSGGAGMVVSLDGSTSPRRVPRHRYGPVSLTISGTIHDNRSSVPRRLTSLEIAFGARGGLKTAGLPRCPRARLNHATQRQALARCRSALVGHGAILTEVSLNPKRPILARAGALAFNGRADGHPAVWVHAYSASPPVSFVLPFHLRRLRTGAYGVLLRAPVARALGRWPRLRSFRITFSRRYRYRGAPRSYLNAHCPLPPRFHIGFFPLARATYHFAPGPTLTTTILRGCRVNE